jgi:hypothetical protein
VAGVQEESLVFIKMPTYAFHVPDDWEFASEVERRSAAAHDGKSSAYFRAAIERDIRGGGPADALSPTVLVDLTRRLLGELDAEEMARAMEGKDQRQKLRRMLERVLSEEFDLDLYGPEYLRDAAPGELPKRIEETATFAGDNFKHFVQRHAARKGERLPIAADAPGDYGPTANPDDPAPASEIVKSKLRDKGAQKNQKSPRPSR